MTAAPQIVPFDAAHRQRQMPVAAPVLQGHRGAAFAPVKHHRFIEQDATERLAHLIETELF